MAKRKQAQVKASPVEISDPDSQTAFLSRYLEWMGINNYAEATIAGRQHYLGLFLHWCQQRDLHRPQEVTRPILESYQRYLYRYRKRDGEPLTVNSQHNHMLHIRSFYRWLSKSHYILYNPASELDVPRQPKRLPRYVLSEKDMEKVLNLPDLTDTLGLRDRAMLETFYSTGVRRLELIHLTREDWDSERGTITVRQGKGHKDRVIPIGERAMYWINRYLYEARPELVLGSDDGTLFLNYNGHPFRPEDLSRRVGNYVKKANVGKQGACHIFRHTLATLMLENGADTRYIQEMLGHACLKTTQLYTQVSILQLKHIHTTTHPGANFTPKQRERLEGKGKHKKQATGTQGKPEMQEIGEPSTLEDAVLLDNEMDEND